jgi:heme/copper-type cytochrome/quinol oxidase subunit 2
MEDMWLVFFWTGPIGVGVFLVSLGLLFYFLAKANEVNKRAGK